jgi:hypothetical protein
VEVQGLQPGLAQEQRLQVPQLPVLVRQRVLPLALRLIRLRQADLARAGSLQARWQEAETPLAPDLRIFCILKRPILLKAVLLSKKSFDGS